jgi:hypothetical protein
MPKNQVRELIRPIGPSIAYVPLTQGQFSVIDVEDIPLVQGSNWNARWDETIKGWYAGGSLGALHRVILGLVKGDKLIADHRNPAATLDNRRANLRIADQRQSIINQRCARRSSTGVKGVFIFEGQYYSDIRLRGKRIRLGRFPLTEAGLAQAAATYRDACLAENGEFSQFGGMQ